MKILFFKIKSILTEENRFGRRTWSEMPSSILLSASYLDAANISLDLLNEESYDETSFSYYDLVFQWVSLADGLYESLDYFRVAKNAGCKTAMVLFDDWEGMQQEIIRDYQFVDFGIRGWDLEETIRQLIVCLDHGKDHYNIPGLVYQNAGSVIDNGRAVFFKDSLTHLVSSKKWMNILNPQLYEHISIRVSSGCAFRCTFCHIGGRPSRFRNYRDVVDELNVLKSGSHVKLLSADVLSNAEWVYSLCKEIIDRQIVVSWETDIRLTSIKEDSLLQLMKIAGCKELTVGVESFHPNIMKAIRKGYYIESIIPTFERILKIGIQPSFSMLLGHPLDSNETLNATFHCLSRLPKGVKVLCAQYLRPLPGTQIEAEAIEMLLLDKPLPYTEFVKSRDKPNLPTKYLSKDELIAWQRILSNEVARINSMNDSQSDIVSTEDGSSEIEREFISKSSHYAFNIVPNVKAVLKRVLPGKLVAKLAAIKHCNNIPVEAGKNTNVRTHEDNFRPESILSIAPHNVRLYEYLIGYLLDRGYRFITLKDIESVSPEDGNKYVILRHDIDFFPEKTDLLVNIEKKYDIKSELYVILDKSYYNIESYSKYFNELHDQGFLVGLHTLAPNRKDFISELRTEIMQFEDILGISPAYFTIHGICPSPEFWNEKRQEFISCLSRLRKNFGIIDSHNFHDEIGWIEDTGVGGELCYIRKKWLQPEIVGSQITGVLTHQLHWENPCVPWDISADGIKEHHEILEFINIAQNGLRKALQK
ncbi:MAG: radical SAM protein [Desulfobacula sp.]|nr:radical SAM protein [Desulfobacula sp.]